MHPNFLNSGFSDINIIFKFMRYENEKIPNSIKSIRQTIQMTDRHPK